MLDKSLSEVSQVDINSNKQDINPPIIIMATRGLLDIPKIEDTSNKKTRENYEYFKENKDILQLLGKQLLQNYKKYLEFSWGAKVYDLEPKKELVDQVYTADASINFEIHYFNSSGEKQVFKASVTSGFGHESRRDEVLLHKEALERIKKEFIGEASRIIIELPDDMLSEGKGNNQSFGNIIITAEGGRFNKVGAEFIAKTFLSRSLSFKPGDSEMFFHSDVAMVQLPGHHIVIYPEAFESPDAYNQFKKELCKPYEFIDPQTGEKTIYDSWYSKNNIDQYLIELNENEAKEHFMANMVFHGNEVVVPWDDPATKEIVEKLKEFKKNSETKFNSIEESFQSFTQTQKYKEIMDDNYKASKELLKSPALKKLRDTGYHVTLMPMSVLIMSGGATHCTINKVNEEHYPNPTAPIEQMKRTTLIQQSRSFY